MKRIVGLMLIAVLTGSVIYIFSIEAIKAPRMSNYLLAPFNIFFPTLIAVLVYDIWYSFRQGRYLPSSIYKQMTVLLLIYLVIISFCLIFEKLAWNEPVIRVFIEDYLTFMPVVLFYAWIIPLYPGYRYGKRKILHDQVN